MEKTKSDPGPGCYVTKRRNEPEPGRGRGGGGQRAWGMWAGRRMRARSGRGRVDVGVGGVGAGDGWRQSTGQRRRGVRVCEFRAPGGMSGGLFVRLVDFLFSKFFPECLPLALGEDFVFFPQYLPREPAPCTWGRGLFPECPCSGTRGRTSSARVPSLALGELFFYFFAPFFVRPSHIIWNSLLNFDLILIFLYFVSFFVFSNFLAHFKFELQVH
jgi:hypothetical protein